MTIKQSAPNEFKVRGKRVSILISPQAAKIGDYEIGGPGEYEVNSVDVEVLNGISLFQIDEMTLVYFGDTKLSEISDEQLEKINGADILMIATGGQSFKPESISQVINQAEPKIVVIGGDKNINEIGKLEGITPKRLDELKVAPGTLSQEELKVIFLNVN
jgi:hypothetical protein